MFTCDDTCNSYTSDNYYYFVIVNNFLDDILVLL